MVEAEKIKAKVSEIYSHNNFMQECGIYIVDMSCGSATVAVKVDPERHANLNGMAHGDWLQRWLIMLQALQVQR